MQLSFSPSYSKCEVFVWVRLTVEVYAFPHILLAGVCLITSIVHNSSLISLICNLTRFRAALYALQSSLDWDFKASCCKKTLCRISDYNLSLILKISNRVPVPGSKSGKCVFIGVFCVSIFNEEIFFIFIACLFLKVSTQDRDQIYL